MPNIKPFCGINQKRDAVVGINQHRTLDLAVREIKEEERRVTVSFSSENPYERWYGMEILQHDAESVDLQRLINIGIGLYNHKSDYVLGRLENIKLDADAKKTYCDIVFDDDEDSEKIYKKVKSGTLKGVSVGYRVDVWEEISAGKKSSNGRFTGPAYVATKWTPYEVSIVSIPADDSVGVGREMENINPYKRDSQLKKGENLMELRELCQIYGLDYDALVARGMSADQIKAELSTAIKTRNASPAPAAPPQAQQKEEQQVDSRAAAKAEQERILNISDICREFKIEEKDQRSYIESGLTVEQVNAKVLENLRAANAPLNAPPPKADDIRMGEQEPDKIRNVVSDAIVLRGGVRIEKPAEGVNEFRGMKLRDVAIDCIMRMGVNNAHRLTDDELFKKALSPDSQFGAILSDSVNKSMATAYNVAPPTYTLWCGVGSMTDFKDAPVYQISEGGALERITQNGEIKFDEALDQKVTKKLYRYAKGWGFTSINLINDDLGMLTKIPQAYTRAAMRGRNKLVYAILGGNANIVTYNKKGVAVTKSLFHSDHDNYDSVGAAITTASLSTGRTAMRTQKNLRGEETLNIAPQFLIVPAALEVKAAQFLRSTADPSANNSGVANVYQNSMTPVVEAELDAYSSTAWYMAASPMDVDTVEVTYLNGNQMPIINSQVGFEYDGIKFTIKDDVGANLIDYRGLYKNVGAEESAS